jgi:hypothetical protein
LVIIQLPPLFTAEAVQRLKDKLAEVHATSGVPVELIIEQNGNKTRVQTAYKLEPNENTLGSLRAIVGASSLIVRS